jgi:hypothetical protein
LAKMCSRWRLVVPNVKWVLCTAGQNGADDHTGGKSAAKGEGAEGEAAATEKGDYADNT